MVIIIAKRRLDSVEVRDVFRTMSNIKDEAIGENNQQLKSDNYFRKKLYVLKVSEYAFEGVDIVNRLNWQILVSMNI